MSSIQEGCAASSYARQMAIRTAECQAQSFKAEAWTWQGDSNGNSLAVSRHLVGAGQVILITRNGIAQRYRFMPHGLRPAEYSRVYCDMCAKARTL